MNETITIGKVAKGARVGIQTVRYYERRGLISAKTRTEKGYRLYKPETSDRIRFIKNAQAIGFTLKEIGGLLRLSVKNPANCAKVLKKAESKLSDIQTRILGLKSLERVLKGLVKSCRNNGTTEDCPVLNCLSGKNRGGFS